MTPLRFRRHVAFYSGLAAAAAGLASIGRVPPVVVPVLCANLFFATYLAISATRLMRMSAADCRHRAAAEDEPVWIIFAVTTAAAAISVAALFVMVRAAHAHGVVEIVLAIAAVPLGWLAVHVMAAHHYAHLWWRQDEAGRKPHGGLEFPGTKEPRGSDFLYFALVIGMTAQTSDVAITDQDMRQVNLLHAVASFFFNTVLIASAVNVAVSLGA